MDGYVPEPTRFLVSTPFLNCEQHGICEQCPKVLVALHQLFCQLHCRYGESRLLRVCGKEVAFHTPTPIHVIRQLCNIVIALGAIADSSGSDASSSNRSSGD